MEEFLLQFDVLRGMTDVVVGAVIIVACAALGVVMGVGRMSAVLLSAYIGLVLFDAIPSQWLGGVSSFYMLLIAFLVIVLALTLLGWDVFSVGGSRHAMQIEWSAAILGVLTGLFLLAVLSRIMPPSAMTWIMTQNIYTLLVGPIIFFILTVTPIGFLLFLCRR